MNHTTKYCINYLFLIVLCLCFFSSCGERDPIVPIHEKGTVVDVDSNVYKTVKIGNQWWMSENLRVTRFRSGNQIKFINTNEDWEQNKEAAYTTYENNAKNLGNLYNYNAVTQSDNIAPLGWHIPSDEEWKELEQYLGLPSAQLDKINWRGSKEGDALKIEGATGEWAFVEGVWGTNESGFSALAASCRFYKGDLGNPGLKGSAFFWTSTPYFKNESWYRYLDYKKSGIFRYTGQHNYGFSIRCVKD